jgi:hypothetical protein
MWLTLVANSVLLGFAQFLAAGTFNYWQAWIFLGVVTVSSVLLTLSMAKNPTLLESRTKCGPTAEKRTIQKIIVLCAAIPGIATFIVPALDRRFGWSNVPWWLSIAGDVLIVVGMWMVFRVFKENSFGSATVEIAKDQAVITTARTPSCGTRCMRARQCTSPEHRWRSVPIGGLAPPASRSSVWSGGSSMKKNSSRKICPAIRNTAPKSIGTWCPGFSNLWIRFESLVEQYTLVEPQRSVSAAGTPQQVTSLQVTEVQTTYSHSGKTFS